MGRRRDAAVRRSFRRCADALVVTKPNTHRPMNTKVQENFVVNWGRLARPHTSESAANSERAGLVRGARSGDLIEQKMNNTADMSDQVECDLT